MAIKHTWTKGIKNDSGTSVIAETEIVTGTAEINLRETVTASGSLDVIVTIDKDAIQSFYIKSNVELTMETNDDGTPDQTIVLEANVAFDWKTTDLAALPITVDITKLTFTNAELTDATLVAGFLLNI